MLIWIKWKRICFDLIKKLYRDAVYSCFLYLFLHLSSAPSCFGFKEPNTSNNSFCFHLPHISLLPLWLLLSIPSFFCHFSSCSSFTLFYLLSYFLFSSFWPLSPFIFGILLNPFFFLSFLILSDLLSFTSSLDSFQPVCSCCHNNPSVSCATASTDLPNLLISLAYFFFNQCIPSVLSFFISFLPACI